MNWYSFATLVAAYALAALFSSSISMTLTLTAWSSVWTYVIIGAWWVLTTYTLWIVPAAIVWIGALIAFVFLWIVFKIVEAFGG